MKRIFIILIGLTLLFSSCAIHHGLTTNANLHTTEVVLSEKNFKVLKSVQGESEAMYVFGLGGLRKEALIAEARANMLSGSDIVGGSKAIINETVEIKITSFVIVTLYKVTVSGHVIEFLE